MLTVFWQKKRLNAFLFKFGDEIWGLHIKKRLTLLLFKFLPKSVIFGFIMGVNWDLFHSGPDGVGLNGKRLMPFYSNMGGT